MKGSRYVRRCLYSVGLHVKKREADLGRESPLCLCFENFVGIHTTEMFCITQPAVECFKLLLSFGVPSCKKSKILKVFAGVVQVIK